MKKLLITLSLLLTMAISEATAQAQLKRVSYQSSVDDTERDYYLYLPNGYNEDQNKQWPVLMFLHGDGERGDGKEDLPFVKVHGALYEAWVQKKDLPFVMIVPQLHMFGRDKIGIPYLVDRDVSAVPDRLDAGVPEREAEWERDSEMTGAVPFPDMASQSPTLPNGWDLCEDDLMGMIKSTLKDFRTDPTKVYLSGLSYGGFGTWFLASKHPDTFAAIAPVVGWGHTSLMEPLADMPVWAFAGGRDGTVQVQYFFDGVNKLEKLGNKNVRFTIHEDVGHDAWKRIYAGRDLYDWLLEFSTK